MRVVVSTIAKFHHFDLARQMERLGVLERLFTGRAPWKMKGENLPAAKVTTFSTFQNVYEGLARLGLNNYPLRDAYNRWCHNSFDSFVAGHLPDCDVLHAMAYVGLKSGLAAQKRGARWVCDGINSHLEYQDQILGEEFARIGVERKPQDPKIIEYANASYAAADLITVPSNFVKNTLMLKGIPESRLAVIPYGVNLSQFKPVPRVDDGVFRVLFVGQISARKGVYDLIEAFRLAAIPGSKLVMVGPSRAEAPALLSRAESLNIEVLGVKPKSELSNYYSQADVMVLPSIEEGLALVMGEALACGCPVIASEHTGGSEIITDGVEGFIVPIRSPELIAAKLVWLYENPDQRIAMREAALKRVSSVGGWDAYGDATLRALEGLLQQPTGAAQS